MDFWQEYTIRGTDFHSQRRKTVKVTARNKSEAEIIAHFKGLVPPYEFIYDFSELGEDAEFFINRLSKQPSESERIEIHTVAKFSEVEIFIKYLNDKNFQPEKFKFREGARGNMLDINFNDGEKISLLIESLSTTLENIDAVTALNAFVTIRNVKIANVKISEPDDEEYEIDIVLKEFDEV